MLCLGTVSGTGDVAAAVRLRDIDFIGAMRLFEMGTSKREEKRKRNSR